MTDSTKRAEFRRTDGTFTSEFLKGNQFAKGNPQNRTTFLPGKYVMEKHPGWKGGIERMEKDCVYVLVAPNKRVRRPKLVWESVYGELPKGMVIYHKDGDHHNDDINNLEAITRAKLARINHEK